MPVKTMNEFDAGQMRRRYEELENEFPDRCRRFGACVEISKRVDALLVDYAKDSGADESADPLPERAKKLGRQLATRCPVGKLINGACGITESDS